MQDIKRSATQHSRVGPGEHLGVFQDALPMDRRAMKCPGTNIFFDQRARRAGLVGFCFFPEDFQLESVRQFQIMQQKESNHLSARKLGDPTTLRLRVVELEQTARIQVDHLSPRDSDAMALNRLPRGFFPHTTRARATKSGEIGGWGSGGRSRATTFLRRNTQTSSPCSTQERTSLRLCWISRTVAVFMLDIMTHIAGGSTRRSRAPRFSPAW